MENKLNGYPFLDTTQADPMFAEPTPSPKGDLPATNEFSPATSGDAYSSDPMMVRDVYSPQPDLNYAGQPEPSQMGTCTQTMPATPQNIVGSGKNEQLLEAQIQWWDAYINLDKERMNLSEQTARMLREQGATESEENAKLGRLNKQVYDAKIDYYTHMVNMSHDGMNQAANVIEEARRNGATLRSDNTRLDKLNIQVIEAKKLWWKGKMEGNASVMQHAVNLAVQARAAGSSIPIGKTGLDNYYESQLNARSSAPAQQVQQAQGQAPTQGRASIQGLAQGQAQPLSHPPAQQAPAPVRGQQGVDGGSAAGLLKRQLTNAKIMWWNARAQSLLAENIAGEARQALQRMGVQAPTYPFDQKNEQVLQLFTQIKQHLSNHNLQEAQRLFQQAKSLADQGATLHIDQLIQLDAPPQPGTVPQQPPAQPKQQPTQHQPQDTKPGAPATPAAPTAPAPQNRTQATIQKAYNITAMFEGPHRYSTIAGNTDRQGMSFGFIQFNFGQGTLQELLKRVNSKHPQVINQVFGQEMANDLRNMLSNMSKEQQVAWGAKKVQSQVWREKFANLGKTPECQKAQIKQAEWYTNKAIELARAYHLKSERGLALMIDIAVQNGAINQTAAAIIREKTAAHPHMNETEKMLVIANAVADASQQAHQAVRERKTCIARGEGKVYGTHHNLEKEFGLTMQPWE